MASNYYWLPKFDPAADFVVSAWPQGFTVNGYQPKPGEPFDKASVSLRILEEHYVKRWIAVDEKPIPETAVAQLLVEKRGRGRPRKNATA
jgi:hypothetical protein